MKPKTPPAPWVPEYGVYLWLALIAVVVVGGWWLVMWAGNQLWP